MFFATMGELRKVAPTRVVDFSEPLGAGGVDCIYMNTVHAISLVFWPPTVR